MTLDLVATNTGTVYVPCELPEFGFPLPDHIPLPEKHRGNGMHHSLGKYARRVRGDRRNSCSVAERKGKRKDWLKEHISQYSIQELVDLTGMNEKAAANLRMGRNKISYDNLCELLENNDDFRARFFEHVGGAPNVPPEVYARTQEAMNAWRAWHAATGGGMVD